LIADRKLFSPWNHESFHKQTIQPNLNSILKIPKAQQVHFPVGDVRYKNKPMSGYVVNPEGTQVTYGGAVPLTRKATYIPTNNTEAAGPPVLEQPKPKPTTNNGPVKTDDLIVFSTPIERISLTGNRLMLKNVPGGDYEESSVVVAPTFAALKRNIK
jgi:hypothetical protein